MALFDFNEPLLKYDASSRVRFLFVASPVSVSEDRGPGFADCPLAVDDPGAALLAGGGRGGGGGGSAASTATRRRPSLLASAGSAPTRPVSRAAAWLRDAPVWKQLPVLLPVLLVRYLLFASAGLAFLALVILPTIQVGRR